MANLSEFYTDFCRIDLDALGGYARVADTVARQEDGSFVHRAFKLMRHELDGKQVGFQRFENELKILADITKDKNAPPAITRIYDSGFAEAARIFGEMVPEGRVAEGIPWHRHKGAPALAFLVGIVGALIVAGWAYQFVAEWVWLFYAVEAVLVAQAGRLLPRL